MAGRVKEYFQRGIDDRVNLLADTDLLEGIEKFCEIVEVALRRGNKIILAGNGGSAADSQHIAAEFISRFQFDRPSLAAIALTTDSSALTAIGNDYGFEYLFSRQLQGLGREGDVFVGISTSGRSQNILNALHRSVELGIKPVLLTGSNLIDFGSDVHCIRVPSSETCFIQEMHISIGHYVCQQVEASIFK